MVIHSPIIQGADVALRAMQPRGEPCWTLDGWTKLNIDGSFVAETGATRGGMVLRDDSYAIIFTACMDLIIHDNRLEAELAACMEGLALALQRTQLPIVDEMDRAETVAMINTPIRNRSSLVVLVQEI